MGALVLSETHQIALITGNSATLNGGWGSVIPTFTPPATSVEFPYSLGSSSDGGFNFSYKANVTSDSSPSEIDDLIAHTDKVAEIHNTLRKGLDVTLIR